MNQHLIRGLSVFLSCLILSFTLCVSTFAAEAPGENLLKNPGFEEGLTNWDTRATLDKNKHTISNDAHTGKSSLLLKSYLTLLQQDGSYQNCAIPETGIYEFSAYVKPSTDGDRNVSMQIGKTIKTLQVPAGKWTRVSVFTYATGGSNLECRIMISSGNPVLVDDTCMKQATTNDKTLNLLDNSTNWKKRGLFNCTWTVTNSEHVHSGTSSWQIGGFADEPYGIYQDFVLPRTGNYEFSFYVNSFGEKETITIQGGEWSEAGTFSDSEWHKLSVVFSGKQGERVSLSIHLNNGNLFYADDGGLYFTDKQPKPLPPPVYTNLLENPGFENALNSWTNHGSASAFASTSAFRSGSQSVMLGYFENEGFERYIEQVRPATKAGTYEFSAYIKTDTSLSGVGAVLFIEARDTNGAVLASKTSTAVPSTGGNWQKASVALSAPAGTASIAVKIGGIYCTGAFYADDASLICK